MIFVKRIKHLIVFTIYKSILDDNYYDISRIHGLWWFIVNQSFFVNNYIDDK